MGSMWELEIQNQDKNILILTKLGETESWQSLAKQMEN